MTTEIELTQGEKDKVNRIVNGNFMISLIKVLQEDLSYFQDTYGGTQKNVFKRILTNAELLFNPKKMSSEEVKEVETISDAMIDAMYDLRKQYRTHVENNFKENRIK